MITFSPQMRWQQMASLAKALGRCFELFGLPRQVLKPEVKPPIIADLTPIKAFKPEPHQEFPRREVQPWELQTANWRLFRDNANSFHENDDKLKDE